MICKFVYSRIECLNMHEGQMRIGVDAFILITRTLAERKYPNSSRSQTTLPALMPEVK